MTDSGAQSGNPPDACDLQALADDWETIWRSEMAALAVDREAHETWHASLAVWTGAAAKILQSLASPADDGDSAAPDAASRPAALDAPFDARNAEIERLAARVAELERRLDGNGGPALGG